MGVHTSRIFRSDLQPKTIPEFVEYDNFIRTQLASVTNANINGLECRTDRTGRITFNDSNFGQLHRYIKSYYQDYKTVSSVPTDTFLRIFDNTDLNGIFFNKSLTLHAKRASTAMTSIEGVKEIGEDDDIMESIELSKRLFNKELDSVIKVDEDSAKQVTTRYSTIIDILNLAKGGKPVCVLTYVSNGNIFHGIAIIVWYKDSEYYCGIYDPLYYERSTEGYIYAVNTAYILFKQIAIINKLIINIYNLSEMFCVKSKKGTHCIQYTIDTEYCAMYSLYFIFLYAKHNFPTNLTDIKPVVEATFIVTPNEIKRNPCKATNTFRFVFMSFILTCLTIITDDNDCLNIINSIYNKILTRYKYQLLPPDIYTLLLTTLAHIVPTASAPSASVTSNVSAPSASVTSNVSEPSASVTSNVSAPSPSVTSNVSAPSASGGQRFTEPIVNYTPKTNKSKKNVNKVNTKKINGRLRPVTVRRGGYTRKNKKAKRYNMSKKHFTRIFRRGV